MRPPISKPHAKLNRMADGSWSLVDEGIACLSTCDGEHMSSQRRTVARTLTDPCPLPPRPLLIIYMAREMLVLMDNMDEVPYGALDLMVLKTLAGLGPLHGYGIARRIEQVAEGSLALNQGTIYPALLRLEQKGWIKSEWGTSENNRRARFYSITRAGLKQLSVETDLWSRTVAMMSRLLEES